MTYGHAYASPSPGAAESALAAPTPASPVPTSLPTPVPETPPQTSSGAYTVQAASAAGSVTGPFGTPFAGGGGDACIGWPPVRPPDVAAECHRPRAPNYLMRGSGYLTSRETSHTSLSNFWCPSGSASPLPGRATNTLVDSQIAFDHIAQRWLATTLSVAPDKPGIYTLPLQIPPQLRELGRCTRAVALVIIFSFRCRYLKRRRGLSGH
jgi:hypothetical protein